MTQIRWMLCTLPVCALALGIGAQSASAQVPPKVIDDFTVGPVGLAVAATGSFVNQIQSGNADHLAGGRRCIDLHVDDNPFGRRAALDIGNGRLIVDTGIHTNHAIVLRYGYDAACEPAGLNLDLSAYEGLRLDFAGMDQGTAGGIVIWSGGGSSSVELSVAPGERFKNIRFADFAPGLVLTSVQHIVIVIQSGGVDPATDYAIHSIKALQSLQ